MLVYKHSSHPLPSPRHAERRAGRSTSGLRDALDAPLDTDTLLTPEAVEQAKVRRERHARRRPIRGVEDGTEEVLLAVGAVIAILVALLVVGFLITSVTG